MLSFSPERRQSTEQKSARVAPPTAPVAEQNHEESPALQLQRTIGNQAVMRLLQTEPERLQSPPGSEAGQHFSPIPGDSKSPTRLQAKLKVSTPGDIYEQEAERAAEQVMRMNAPALQRSRASQRGAELHAEPAHAPVADDLLPALGPGRPLDSATRDFFEPRFGRDFSGVRVHTDATASASAGAVNASAYTVGRDIVFGDGAYAPDSATGRSLLAHELAHVVQQDQAGTGAPRSDNGSDVAVSALPGRMVQRQSSRAFAALTLSSISCVMPDDFGGDEVYITVNGMTVWGPVSMDTGDNRQINHRTIFSTGPLVVRVFDREWPLSDDEIGSVTIPMPTTEEEIRQAPSSAFLSTHGMYRLFFQVHRV